MVFNHAFARKWRLKYRYKGSDVWDLRENKFKCENLRKKYQEQELKGKKILKAGKRIKIIFDNKRFAVRWLQPMC